MSYTHLLYHIVFRTKDGIPSISEENERHLYRYIWKFTSEEHCVLHRVNGMPDHIHLFVAIHQSIAVSEFVRKLKKSTHLFLEKNSELFPEFSQWSVGYCALSYSERDKDKVINYIKNQKDHHKSHNFTDEMKNIFTDNNLKFDETFFDKNL